MGVTTDNPARSTRPVNNLINQSGLSSSYTSGVTDFDSFVASTTHSDLNNSYHAQNSGGLPAHFSFDMGSSVSLSSVAFWGTPNVGDFGAIEVFSDTDGIFGNGGTTSLGSFTFVETGSGSSNPQTFSFPDINTQFIHLEVTSFEDPGICDTTCFMFGGEVAFEEGASVPVPFEVSPTLGLLTIGGIWGVSRLRKKRGVSK